MGHEVGLSNSASLEDKDQVLSGKNGVAVAEHGEDSRISQNRDSLNDMAVNDGDGTGGRFPFNPPYERPSGVSFTSGNVSFPIYGLGPNAKKARLIVLCLVMLVFTLACAVGLTVLVFKSIVPSWCMFFLVLPLAIWGWLAWLFVRQVEATGYAQLEDELLIYKGVMFRSTVVVPYGRMQYVDIDQGPVERLFGLASIKLHTAAANTDADICGLSVEEAHRLRQNLTVLGEQRMAGL